MRVYEKLWNEIDEKDWPDNDEIFICLDPQKRLGNWTWSVSRMGNRTLEGDIVQLGLFYQKNHAIMFAKVYEGGKYGEVCKRLFHRGITSIP